MRQAVELVKRARASGSADATHPEAVRFSTRSDGIGLLVARWDFLRDSAQERGITFGSAGPEPADRLWVIEEFEDWEAFRFAVNWPTLVAGHPATPWERAALSYEDYRLRSPGADGELWQPSVRPHESTFGWGSDKGGTVELRDPEGFTDEELGLDE